MSTMTVETKINHKYLMGKTKWELANWYLEAIDKADELEADNARLRQQLQSLVEAWNRYQNASMADKVMATMKLRDAFLAVQAAQETEEK